MTHGCSCFKCTSSYDSSAKAAKDKAAKDKAAKDKAAKDNAAKEKALPTHQHRSRRPHSGKHHYS